MDDCDDDIKRLSFRFELMEKIVEKDRIGYQKIESPPVRKEIQAHSVITLN